MKSKPLTVGSNAGEGAYERRCLLRLALYFFLLLRECINPLRYHPSSKLLIDWARPNHISSPSFWNHTTRVHYSTMYNNRQIHSLRNPSMTNQARHGYYDSDGSTDTDNITKSCGPAFLVSADSKETPESRNALKKETVSNFTGNRMPTTVGAKCCAILSTTWTSVHRPIMMGLSLSLTLL